ncbi:hypothetical protein FOA52_006948 [Chlamydomonas sp. UWO 241]|nr:hypothetical protein FOA52_006948 [Chlamydomonas sp. UWO 241]
MSTRLVGNARSAAHSAAAARPMAPSAACGLRSSSTNVRDLASSSPRCCTTSATSRAGARQRARRVPGPTRVAATAPADVYPPADLVAGLRTDAPQDVEYDCIVIGSGMGGLATAVQMSAKGAKVLVLEKYLVPGGSAAHFKREGYTFDVGSSMMFGFGDRGSTNLITKCLEAVGKHMATVPDPTQVLYHLPKSPAHPDGLNVPVWRAYDDFVAELSRKFPHEAKGIKGFYDECWKVFNALNSIELKSLEEPRYLMAQFARSPLSCLMLASFAITNTGEVARKHISDPELLKFIDLECYIWSTVNADFTPMINSGMVFCDRHYGGINYPVGGVGLIAENLADGIEENGGAIVYKANVKEIVLDEASGRATGVRLADGRVFKGRSIVSNATRWDTFEKMIGDDRLPEGERLFRGRYKKAPSFFTMHLGVQASALPAGTDCHHIILEDWANMEDPRGTVFLSLPSTHTHTHTHTRFYSFYI